MEWLLIGLLLLAAVGPAFYFMPSKKDRRLARMRQQAHLEGLSVQLAEVRKLNPQAAERVSSGGEVRTPVYATAAYALPLRRRLIGFA